MHARHDVVKANPPASGSQLSKNQKRIAQNTDTAARQFKRKLYPDFGSFFHSKPRLATTWFETDLPKAEPKAYKARRAKEHSFDASRRRESQTNLTPKELLENAM